MEELSKQKRPNLIFNIISHIFAPFIESIPTLIIMLIGCGITYFLHNFKIIGDLIALIFIVIFINLSYLVALWEKADAYWYTKKLFPMRWKEFLFLFLLLLIITTLFIAVTHLNTSFEPFNFEKSAHIFARYMSFNLIYTSIPIAIVYLTKPYKSSIGLFSIVIPASISFLSDNAAYSEVFDMYDFPQLKWPSIILLSFVGLLMTENFLLMRLSISQNVKKRFAEYKDSNSKKKKKEDRPHTKQRAWQFDDEQHDYSRSNKIETTNIDQQQKTDTTGLGYHEVEVSNALSSRINHIEKYLLEKQSLAWKKIKTNLDQNLMVQDKLSDPKAQDESFSILNSTLIKLLEQLSNIEVKLLEAKLLPLQDRYTSILETAKASNAETDFDKKIKEVKNMLPKLVSFERTVNNQPAITHLKVKDEFAKRNLEEGNIFRHYETNFEKKKKSIVSFSEEVAKLKEELVVIKLVKLVEDVSVFDREPYSELLNKEIEDLETTHALLDIDSFESGVNMIQAENDRLAQDSDLA